MRELAAFLRERQDEILARWEHAVRALPAARSLPRDRLVDFIPGLLERVATHLDELAQGQDGQLPRTPARQHAQDRIQDHYTLPEVVEELSILRETIEELWYGGEGPHRTLNRALDHAILASVEEFTVLRDRERMIREEALRKSEARLRCLAKAGSLLASTLEYQQTLDHVAQMVVPEFADWCAVDLLRPDGSLGDFVAAAHADSSKVELIREIRRRRAPRMSSNLGVPLAIRTKKPLLVEQVDEKWLDANALDEEHRRLMVELGVGSLVIVPLTSREIAFGALILANAESGRRFTPEDLAFTEELGRRAAGAIDNARLYEESQRAVELRDRILAVVSHDLRNPLGAVDLGAALLLKNTAVRNDPISRKQTETIQRSAGRMDRLISDLLDMSSIQAGRLSLHRDSCRLTPLLTEAADAHEAVAREKGIEIVRDLELGEIDVFCDHDRMIQVLSNLLGNAIKFCRGGDTVTLSAKPRGREALISVSDTGPGIGREEMSHVFELYWQGKAREHRGTGLGLFISRGIVEAHGGQLWVESRVGTGSTFYLTLPIWD